MKLKIFTLILFFLLVLVSTSNAQFQIGPGAGYTTFYGENFTKDISEGGAGISGGIRYGAKARLFIPVLPINVVGHFFYSPLSSDGSYNFNGTTGTLEISSSMMNLGVGAELTLFPAGIKPYLGVDLLYNNIGTQTTTFSVNGQQLWENESESKGRTGLGFGIGARFTLLPIIDLETSLKYNMLNLFGKEDGEESLNSINFNVFVMF